jgi:glycosyltransferase involved in cell wall biosynthesis
MISVIIRTIGRPTLRNSIESALAEFDNVVVVADAVDLDLSSLPPEATYLRTGHKSDKYGSLALNMGAYSVVTPYLCLLDDDDEFVEGAGKFMTDFVSNNSELDIIIPGIHFVKMNMIACMDPYKGITMGNVAVPTYRTSLFDTIPISKQLVLKYKLTEELVDFSHILECHTQGAKIGWYEKILYRVRPKLEGTNGRGI